MLLPKSARKLISPAATTARRVLTELVNAGDTAALTRMRDTARTPETRQLMTLAIATIAKRSRPTPFAVDDPPVPTLEPLYELGASGEWARCN